MFQNVAEFSLNVNAVYVITVLSLVMFLLETTRVVTRMIELVGVLIKHISGDATFMSSD